MIKVAVLVLAVLAAVGMGYWYWYDVDDDLRVGIQVRDASLTADDTIPMDLLVRFESGKDHDIEVSYFDINILDREGGVLLTSLHGGRFTIPAHGFHEEEYKVVLRNVDAETDGVLYVDLTVHYNGRVRSIEREVDIGEYI